MRRPPRCRRRRRTGRSVICGSTRWPTAQAPLAAIRDIGEQGEGATGDVDASHFGRLLGIYRGRAGLAAFPADGDWVAPATCRPIRPWRRSSSHGHDGAPNSRTSATRSCWACSSTICAPAATTACSWRAGSSRRCARDCRPGARADGAPVRRRRLGRGDPVHAARGAAPPGRRAGALGPAPRAAPGGERSDRRGDPVRRGRGRGLPCSTSRGRTVPASTSSPSAAPARPPSTSFARDILPLFRPKDIEHMAAIGLDLRRHDATKAKADATLTRVRSAGPRRMPRPRPTLDSGPDCAVRALDRGWSSRIAPAVPRAGHLAGAEGVSESMRDGAGLVAHGADGLDRRRSNG